MNKQKVPVQSGLKLQRMVVRATVAERAKCGTTAGPEVSRRPSKKLKVSEQTRLGDQLGRVDSVVK